MLDTPRLHHCVDLQRAHSAFAGVIFLLALACTAAPSAAQRPEAATSPSAWDVLVDSKPVDELEAIPPLERRVLDVLSPEQGTALAQGDDDVLELEKALTTILGRGASARGGTMSFIRLEPCLIADTRRARGPFADDQIRHYVVRGETTDLSPQGGSSTGCGVPGLAEGLSVSNLAQAVLLHFEVIGAQRTGKLTAWAANQPQPLLTHLSYERGDSRTGPTSGLAVVPLCDAQSLDPCPFGDLRLKLSGGAHLVTAVHGYFVGDETVPTGLISMWSGSLAEIPRGWVLCDGTEGTPDLRDRFILGTAGSEEPGATGGVHAFSLTPEQLAEHGHAVSIESAGSHAHPFYRPIHGLIVDYSLAFWPGVNSAWSSWAGETAHTSAGGEHSHAATLETAGAGAAIDNRPAFFTLAFIMKR
ncbi:MAG: hypothetical protein AAGC60_15885 [Acidobacteriota bacterium]